ncbi:ABC transporter substrate-binding protein [Bradyrhizobium sp. JYMT SZCCT0180]|uniref:ABC transporter substrate-binding protein n=1 Tax=Bradyrhizobium sp. JYMT SZCCT0180 TaxID=2807666 RepID=UPI001BA5B7C8|nr:ABC transporter substrate-binding protein [Bradyrhizobium sp. JYMT SZCCT0180]MBR1215188.1 ABC transporter substrate-binding protein [Bradyrhizobium sp. JYMT SZCCT0180]
MNQRLHLLGILNVDRPYAILPDLLKEVVGLRPDVIVAEATPAVAAAQKATSTIPIVMSPASDPVGSGFVESFARPGGNITGVANMFGDATTKTLDIIRLVLPNVKMIGVLISNNPTHPRLLEVAKQAAASMAIFAEGFVAPNPDDLERAFAEMKSANCDAVYVLADPVRPAIPGIALKSGLPTIYQVNTYVTEGGLMSYGPDVPVFFQFSRPIRRPYSQRREASRDTGRAAHKISVRREPPHSQRAWIDHSGVGAAHGGQGDRVADYSI